MYQNPDGRPVNPTDVIKAAWESLLAVQDIMEQLLQQHPDLDEQPVPWETLVQQTWHHLSDVELDLRMALRVNEPETPDKEFTPDGAITTEEGDVFTPWTNGWAVGFRCDSRHGVTEYVYLNPSGGTEGHAPNAFIYYGPDGDPGTDHTLPMCIDLRTE